jgi:hypothetical protein
VVHAPRQPNERDAREVTVSGRKPATAPLATPVQAARAALAAVGALERAVSLAVVESASVRGSVSDRSGSWLAARPAI